MDKVYISFQKYQSGLTLDDSHLSEEDGHEDACGGDENGGGQDLEDDSGQGCLEVAGRKSEA